VKRADQRCGEGVWACEQTADAMDGKIHADDGAQQHVSDSAIQLRLGCFVGKRHGLTPVSEPWSLQSI
jgi:hypothetical protein